MAPTPEQTRAGYHKLWNRAQIKPEKTGAAHDIARRIAANRDKYDAVEKATGVPWFMIGALHSRESSLAFNAHLHCGDPLTARTVHMPKGRPKAEPANGKSYTWTESAIDALTMPGKRLDEIKDWSVERILYECERYNGWGYLSKGNSPYLWSWTSEYHGGKYVADHVYDPHTWDKQAGCAALFKTLAELDPAVASRLARRQPAPPKDVVDRATKTERDTRAGGAVVAGGSTLAEGGQQSTVPVVPSFVTYGAIGIGLALVLIATVLIVRKIDLINEKWS